MIGPSVALEAAVPDTALVVKTSLVGARTMFSVCVADVSGLDAAVSTGVPTAVSP